MHNAKTRILHGVPLHVELPTRAAVFLLLVAIVGSGCRRAESQAPTQVREPTDQARLVERNFPDVGSFHLPEGWHIHQGEYASQYGNQYYHMIRARRVEVDEDQGLLSIDISPSHPRLWRKPLHAHVRARIRALGAIGPVTSDRTPHTTAALPYDAEESVATVNGELRTVFRIFRQKSRVLTVAVTAGLPYFDLEASKRMVDEVSARLVLHLPVIRFRKPDLSKTALMAIGDLMVQVPAGWRLIRHVEEQSMVPAETFELTPPNPDMADDPPTLNLALVRLSSLGTNIEVEAIAVGTGGSRLPQEHQASATLFQVDSDTLGAARMVKVGSELLTITYAAPDYLFEIKPALTLLEKITHSVSLVAASSH